MKQIILLFLVMLVACDNKECESSHVYAVIDAFTISNEISDQSGKNMISMESKLLEITDSINLIKLHNLIFKYERPSIEILPESLSNLEDDSLRDKIETDTEMLFGMKEFGDSAHYRILIYSNSSPKDSVLLVMKKTNNCFKLTDIRSIP